MVDANNAPSVSLKYVLPGSFCFLASPSSVTGSGDDGWSLDDEADADETIDACDGRFSPSEGRIAQELSAEHSSDRPIRLYDWDRRFHSFDIEMNAGFMVFLALYFYTGGELTAVVHCSSSNS